MQMKTSAQTIWLIMDDKQNSTHHAACTAKNQHNTILSIENESTMWLYEYSHAIS